MEKEKYNEYMKKYMIARYHKKMDQIRCSLGGKCYRCGSMDNLEIDHINPSNKSYTVARMWSIKETKLQEEIKKCQLLCQSCHNLKTLKQNNMNPAKGFHGTISTVRYCKCRLCKDAKNAYMREWKKRRRK